MKYIEVKSEPTWVYEAEDGERFATRGECYDYERTRFYEPAKKAYIENVLIAELPLTNIIRFFSGDGHIHVVRMRNKEDFDTLVKHFGYCSDPDFEEPSHYPSIRVVMFDEGYATFMGKSGLEEVASISQSMGDCMEMLKPMYLAKAMQRK